jgi:ABC-2 type transport system ATP-binding protein
MASSAEAIRADKLTRCFGDLTAVADLDLAVRPGEIFGLVGPDGAGKTTTLRMLAGILDPTSGRALITGHDAATESSLVKDNLAYMAQRFGLYEDLTVEENAEFYADLFGVPRRERRDRIDTLLRFSYMHPFKKRLAGKLSGGMKQKLQLVCALIHTPRVLLLDEPTNGVDPVSRRDFWRMLYQLLKQDVAILVATAYLDEAERCNRVGLMDRGRLLASGTPGEIRKLLPGHLIRIATPDSRNVSHLLRDDPDLTSVTLFGDSVHVVCDSRDKEEELRERIAAAGLAVREIRPEKPSLEDVFVSVLAPRSGGKPASETMAAPRPGRPTESGQAEAAVRVQDLTRRFGKFVAVDRIGFEVPHGQIFGFLGPNGAGKSTTIRMLCGLLEPSGGEGTVAGFDIRTQPEQIKQHIGYMSQRFSLYQDLTVEENLRFYGGIYGLQGKRLEERMGWALGMADLQDHRHSRTAILSGGWKQRLALACAILHEPPILFLDEPTSGVDPLSRRRFWEIIHTLAEQGVTVFVTTHYMEEAEYCDRLSLIYRGEMIALATPEELKTRYMTDRILDVRCARPQEVMEDLAALPEVREVALFGNGLHAVVEDADRAGAAIRAELERLGTAAERVTPVPPGIEDVFVSLIEAADRRREQEGA